LFIYDSIALLFPSLLQLFALDDWGRSRAVPGAATTTSWQPAQRSLNAVVLVNAVAATLQVY
jgi:hypothetical protein